MIELITTIVSAGGLMLAIATFIVNRYDKKMAEREKVLTDMNTEFKKMQLQTTNELRVLQTHAASIDSKISNVETRSTVIERDAAKLEATIENQIGKLGEKLDNIYKFLLEANRRDHNNP